MDTTDEFSFILKPSKVSPGGVGVFAAHDIAKGTKLLLFDDQHDYRVLRESEVPELFQGFCLGLGGSRLGCPNNFNHMSIGWYLNHSDHPNAYHDDKYSFFALSEIKEDEEITIDYKKFNEPPEQKEGYY